MSVTPEQQKALDKIKELKEENDRLYRCNLDEAARVYDSGVKITALHGIIDEMRRALKLGHISDENEEKLCRVDSESLRMLLLHISSICRDNLASVDKKLKELK